MAKKTLQASAEATAAVQENRAIGEKKLPTLRELGQARSILDLWLVETEGEETPELTALWAQLEGDTKQKVVNWGHYLHTRDEQALLMEADEKFYAAEAARLRERRIAFAAQTDKSYDALLFQMQEQSIDEAADEYITVKRQRNPAKLIGEVDPEKLAEWFQSENTTLVGFVRYTPEAFALDRQAVKDAAKNVMIERLPEGLELVATERVVIK